MLLHTLTPTQFLTLKIGKEFAAKEKLEIVSGAAKPQFRNFAGGFFRQNAFGLSLEYCTIMDF